MPPDQAFAAEPPEPPEQAPQQASGGHLCEELLVKMHSGWSESCMLEYTHTLRATASYFAGCPLTKWSMFDGTNASTRFLKAVSKF